MPALRRRGAALGVLLAGWAWAAPALAIGRDTSADVYASLMIGAPPAALKLDPFYTQYADALGIPVVGSPKVPKAALLLARDIVDGMLAARPDVRRTLVAEGTRVAIMAPDEQTMDLPEQRDWTKPAADDPRLTEEERTNYQQLIGRLTDREYWNGRSRGMGGTLTSAAAENLLAGAGDRYHGENILVHEFSHVILMAVAEVDPPMFARVEAAYAAAMAKGLWRGDYAATTVQEYWAEGTQFWFNSNMLSRVGVLSDRDLARYDPALAALLGQVYGPQHRLAADLFYCHADRTAGAPVPATSIRSC
jgi:hypothetical protein